MRNPLRELIQDDPQRWFTKLEMSWLLVVDLHDLESRELLSVPSEHGDQRLYPAYQFDPETGRPWSVVKTLRQQFESADLGNWLMVWLAKPCPSFDNQPPSAHLSTLPDQVVASASRFIICRLANPQTPPVANQNHKRIHRGLIGK